MTKSGENNLELLLKNASPKLHVGEFVFCTDPNTSASYMKVDPVMTFCEKEGKTYLLRVSDAKKVALTFQGRWAWIEMQIHSDLEAVGFLAELTKRLANAGISVNAVSAYYHDHLFVPVERAEEAMKLLEGGRL